MLEQEFFKRINKMKNKFIIIVIIAFFLISNIGTALFYNNIAHKYYKESVGIHQLAEKYENSYSKEVEKSTLLENEIEDLKTKNKELENAHSSILTSKRVLENTNERLRKKIKNLENRDLEEEIRTLKEENISLKEKIATIEDENEGLKATVASLSQQTQVVQEQQAQSGKKDYDSMSIWELNTLLTQYARKAEEAIEAGNDDLYWDCMEEMNKILEIMAKKAGL